MVFRPIDTQKPATRLQKWNDGTYTRSERRHDSAAHIHNNERYNNEARLINAQRCRRVEAGHPPNGLLRLVDPISGQACAVAPRRIQGFSSILPEDLHAISEHYGFRWVVPREGVVTVGVPTSMVEMLDDYCAHVGAADFY